MSELAIFFPHRMPFCLEDVWQVKLIQCWVVKRYFPHKNDQSAINARKKLEILAVNN